MDVQKLLNMETMLNKLGYDGDYKSPEYKDVIDKAANEYKIGASIYAIGDRRKKKAREVLELLCEEDIEILSEQATKHMSAQEGTLAMTDNFIVSMKAGKPVEAFDVELFVTELIKAGVGENVIKSAREAARKLREPARSFMITRPITRT